jgi:hypothetical protein
MVDSNNPGEEAESIKIANGKDLDQLLSERGLPLKAPTTAPHVPIESVVNIEPAQFDLIEPALEPKKPKPSKMPKPVSALNLLEKLAAKQTNDELKKQTKELLAQLELSPFEMAIAQHLDVADGEIDRSQFVLEAFASKKLLAYALKVEPPLLSTETLLDMWLNPKFKAVRSAVEKALKNVKTVSPSELDSEAIAKLRSLLRTQDEKIISAWLENLILPLQVKMSSSDGAALLENLYGKFDPKKGASAGLRDLLATSIEWLAQSQNLAQLDQAITDASGLSAGPYARIVHATRKMPFKVGSARYSFVVSLLKSRERKTVTFLAQTGIFDDFTLDGIGLLAANEETFAHISSNEAVLGAIKDECRRRLKSEDIAKVHYWLLKYPNVRQWLTDAQLLQRLRPQDDYLSRLLFEEGRRVGELEASERSEVEVTGLKDEIRASDLEKKKLTAELESLSERFAELEQRLRNAANSAQGAKDDQIRQAQIDSVKVLIEFMNSIEISTSIDGGTRSSLEATRAKLKSFGVAWRHEIGSIVPFTAQDHLSSGLQDGAMVQILTPCYYLQNTPTQIALVKARVLPQ